MRRDSKEIGLSSFPKDDQPPVVIPFFAFRAMVGCELLMIALAWPGSFHLLINRKKGEWLLSCATFLSLPLPFIATLTGWFTLKSVVSPGASTARFALPTPSRRY
jgi:cytochrome bd ubiquinol oxidase subunit I